MTRFGDYKGKVLTVLTGTVASQAIPIVLMPALTRLFSPDDFGTLSLFLAAATIAAVPATAAYDIALFLPKEKEKSANLLTLSLCIAVCFSVLLFLATYIWGDEFTALIDAAELEPYLWALPIAVLFIASFQTLSSWLITQQRFKGLALARIAQSAAISLLQIVIGLSVASATSLIAGQLIGQTIGIATVVYLALSRDWTLIRQVNFCAMRELGALYRRFPIYSLPANFINVLANQAPMFLMTAFFGPVVVGLYALTQRIVAAPISIVGNAFLEVFKQRASDEYKNHGHCRTAFRQTFRALAWLGLIPCLPLLLFAPPLIAWLFGEPWREAGVYAQLLAPMLYIRFIASPLAYVLYVAERQNYDLIWQVGLLVSTSLALVAGSYAGSPRLGIGLFSGAYFLMYVLYLWLSFRFAQGRGAGREARS